jgi:hypothetical protein
MKYKEKEENEKCKYEGEMKNKRHKRGGKKKC